MISSKKFEALLFCVLQAVVEGAAGPQGGTGEAGGHEPEAFSGKRAADVQTEAQGLVSDHPPAGHGAGDRAEMTLVPAG